MLVLLLSYKQSTPNKPLVAYRILRTDSVYVTPANLPKNKPVLVMYFSPDCSHCQRFTSELLLAMDNEAKHHKKLLASTQIVMVTYALLPAIQDFYRDYELKKYPNITVGTEGYTYVVQRYYDVHTTPYIALYNKAGKMVASYSKSPRFADVYNDWKKML